MMTLHRQILLSLLCELIALIVPTRGEGAARFTQIVLPFPNERVFNYYYNKPDNALVLELSNTTTDDLKALDTYDESLVRRLTLKEKNASLTEVKIFLRDRDIRAAVSNFEEPFRIVIDLFDKNFSENRDARSGFPFTNRADTPEAGTFGYMLEGAEAHGPPVITESRPSQSPAKESFPLVRQSETQSNDMPSTLEIAAGDALASRRRLLQPQPDALNNPEELSQTLKNIPNGPGGAWKQFPPYIYLIQLASFKAGKSYKDFLSKNAERAVTSMDAMADYAAKLFDFGHEGRALAAYSQVIHKSPLLFDKQPMHLWRLAEIHLGQGNFTLADGYYAAMVTKHPDHPLSNFAKMRQLDIRALRLIKRGETQAYDVLAKSLAGIPSDKDIELNAQITLRKVYWSQDEKNIKNLIQNPFFIPTLTPEDRVALESSYNKIENPWTGFLVATVLLNDNLSLTRPWDKQTADMASFYFKNFNGAKVELYQQNIKEKLTKKINTLITEQVDKEDYLGAIKIYESLDPSLKELPHTAQTSWSLGQAYRLLGQSNLAVPHYRKAVAKIENSVNRFNAQFWLTMTITDTIDQMTSVQTAGSADREKLKTEQNQVNGKLWQSWRELKPAEQQKLLVSMRVPLEGQVKSQSLVSTPARILLEGWDRSLNTKVSEATSDADSLKTAYAPTGATVETLRALAEKFKRLGLDKEWEKSRHLLTKLDPKSFDSDIEIERAWASSLVELAETYRTANKYLDAGRIYTLTGANSRNWEGRAEALYKGGLLLYRAGRKQEALDALTKASQDGNNALYAELAKKRLDQLNN